ncbi:MAG: tRNA-binding protein [Flavobacteriaceae bacterium]|nr:tRNA-binding protein [Flavobacteriaceae bacterium]
MSNILSWEDFHQVELRVGTICSSEVFSQARTPAYRLIIDFGPLGQKKSSAQLTEQYTPEALIGKQVVAVVNFPPKQIANFMSECLVLGVVGDAKGVVLLTTDIEVENGLRIA